MADDNDIDDRDFYEPAWLSQPRGFIDFPSAQADALNDLLEHHLPLFAEKTISQRRWCFKFPDLEIELITDPGQLLVVSATSPVIGRKYLDSLRVSLRAILNRSLLDCDGSFTAHVLGVMLLQMAEEGEICLQSWRAVTASKTTVAETVAGEGWNAKAIDFQSAYFLNPHGVNLTTADDTARFLLGQSISEICADFPSNLRILHVEPVFRPDLVSRFLAKKQQIHNRLKRTPIHLLQSCLTHEQMKNRHLGWDDRHGIAAALAEPAITFHGAVRHVVRSIVRYGFLIPGQKIGETKETLAVRCGSTYGIGVYSSPDPEYGSSYAGWGDGGSGPKNFESPANMPGMRLIVCATLMGMPAQVLRSEARGMEGTITPDADSHVSHNKLEYIVFDPAQIVPCYVLHVDYGTQHANEKFEEMVERRSQAGRLRAAERAGRFDGFRNCKQVDSPGDLQRQKEARKAAASKWFPYGFGPMQGAHFKIEEIGKVSDDEEDYGEFQAMRHEEEEAQRYGQGGRSWFDEYQTVRSTHKELKLDAH